MEQSDKIQNMLKAYVSVPLIKYREMDMMLETFHMIQDELIEMGLLDKGVAPMFITQSIAMNVKKMRDDYWEQGAELRTDANTKIREKFSKVAFGYDSTPWKHDPALSHVADMVSVAIGRMILDTEV